MRGEVRGVFGVLEQDGRILLVANWRDLGAGEVLCWDVPGGHVEPGESLPEACRRELMEETGHDVRVGELLFMIERFGFRDDPADVRACFVFFRVHDEGPPGRASDPEIVDLEFLDPIQISARCTQAYQAAFLAWLDSGKRLTYVLDRG